MICPHAQWTLGRSPLYCFRRSRLSVLAHATNGCWPSCILRYFCFANRQMLFRVSNRSLADLKDPTDRTQGEWAALIVGIGQSMESLIDDEGQNRESTGFIES